ncbi:hypothetical protein DFH09DRAFT_1452411 [Mycena vulgaris]|nr:hypothetical protein DFH09DRAFT_1452411 [Mycena vulgaris]
MHGSFSAITKYIHYAPILRPGSPKFEPRVKACPRIPTVEPLGHSAALRLNREDPGCRGELSFELILGQKPNRAPGFPFVYKKWPTSTYPSLNHPPPTLLLLLHLLPTSLPPHSYAPIASVRKRTIVIAENELAAVEPLNFGSSLDAVLSVSINRGIGHDAAAPSAFVYLSTQYHRDTASPYAIPTLRRKPADAVIPAYGRTNTVPPPLPTQTDVPSASRCLSDSASQVWLNIDERNFDSVDFAEVFACPLQISKRSYNSRMTTKANYEREGPQFELAPILEALESDQLGPRIVNRFNFAPTEVRTWDSKGLSSSQPLPTLISTRSDSRHSNQTLFQNKTRKTVIVHLDYEVFRPDTSLTPPDLKLNIAREAVSLLPRFGTPRLSSLKMLEYTLLQVILKHRGLEIFQIYIEVSHQLPPSRSKSMTIDRDHKTKKTILLLTQNDSAPQESRGIFLSRIFSESRGPRGCVTKRPLSMASSRCPMNGVQVIFHVLSVVTHIDLHFHLRLGTHSISTRSNSGLRVRLVFSSTTMVSSHSLSQNGHNLSIPSNVPKCCLPASCIRSRDSGLSTSLTPQPLSGLLGTDTEPMVFSSSEQLTNLTRARLSEQLHTRYSDFLELSTPLSRNHDVRLYALPIAFSRSDTSYSIERNPKARSAPCSRALGAAVFNVGRPSALMSTALLHCLALKTPPIVLSPLDKLYAIECKPRGPSTPWPRYSYVHFPPLKDVISASMERHSDQLPIWDSTHKPGSRACVLRSEASEAYAYNGGEYPACMGSVTEAPAGVYVRSEARRGRDAGETQLATEASEPRVCNSGASERPRRDKADSPMALGADVFDSW